MTKEEFTREAKTVSEMLTYLEESHMFYVGALWAWSFLMDFEEYADSIRSLEKSSELAHEKRLILAKKSAIQIR